MVKKIRTSWKSLSKTVAAAMIGIVAFCLFTTHKFLYLTAEPGKDKECEALYPQNLSLGSRITAVFAPVLSWLQKGGVINDASCMDQTAIYGVVSIKSEQDIANALQFARDNKLKISIAGVKHSMGGQAFAKGNLVLDMTVFNTVHINDARETMTVRSGATAMNGVDCIIASLHRATLCSEQPPEP